MGLRSFLVARGYPAGLCLAALVACGVLVSAATPAVAAVAAVAGVASPLPRLPGPAGAGLPRPGLPLARAPAGLRAAASAVQQAELTASDGAAGHQFGSSVAVTGTTALIGAPFKNSGTGAAYVFSL